MEDITKYTPMMQQYLNVKKQYQDMLVFFRLGDFYELFFDDAIKTSKLLEITLTSRAGGKDAKVPMCGVPYHAAHHYIQKLVDMGEKIAIVEQTSEPTKGVGLVSREVTKIITPGTFVQEGDFAADSASYVAAIYYQNGYYTLAYGDISIGKYYYVQNMKDQYAVLDHLRIIKAREVVYLDEQAKCMHVILDAIERSAQAAIPTFTPTCISTVPAVIHDVFSILESYLISIRPDSMLSFQGIFEIAYERAMYMNNATMASLELFETVKNRDKKGSLFALLDQTKTALGSRLLRTWIRSPLTHAPTIEERLDIVAFLVEHYIERKKLQQILAKIYDVERLTSRISAETAGPRELHQLKQTMLALDDFATYLASIALPDPVLKGWQGIGDLLPLRDELVRALATEDINTLNETGLFHEGYSADLDELRQIAQGGTTWLLHLEQEEKARTGIKNLRIKYNKVFGYFIEVSKGNAHLVKPEWGYERKQTLTNAERYVTDTLKEKEAQILTAKERYVQLEKQLFLELCRKITPFRVVLQKLADFIAWLDVLQAFAEVSQESDYCRPELATDHHLVLQASRHPIIEQVIGEAFIANEVRLDASYMLLITGPNMAGKSTYMRQIALASILHQIGCFVPAQTAKMPIFDAIYTRIGAQDDLFSGQSTFMVEMNEVAQALAGATADSLLLFDEIGRGTATFDGLALAYAIFRYIQQSIGARTLFSTHYHELTTLTKTMPGVRNIHVAASLVDNEIIFHHHIQEGSIERSYGVQVAKLAQLPEAVISEAQKLLLVLEANQPKLDAELVEAEHMDAIISLHSQKAQLLSEKEAAQNLLEKVLRVDLDALSPRDVVAQVSHLQQAIKTARKNSEITSK